MLIKKYPDFESAEAVVTKLGSKYLLERRELESCGSVDCHYHPRVQERIIVKEGAFLLAVEGTIQIIRVKKGEEFAVLYFPSGEAHSFLAISKVCYSMYKTGKDRAVHCKGPDLKKILSEMLVAAKRITEYAFQKEE